MKNRNRLRRCFCALLVLASALACRTAFAAEKTVSMLPGENWWGLGGGFGRHMPFDAQTDFKCDLRVNNYANAAASLLVSDRGRVIWCAEPVEAAIAGGKIRLASGGGEILLAESSGGTLAEAFRFASKNYFPPTGGLPELLYFSAPQYNTWIELTYHQNEKDVLAYAQSMLDRGLPPGVFMIDDTWQLDYGTWDFDPLRFPDPKGMVEKLHSQGFKVLLWMCPFVSMDSPAFRLLEHGKSPDTVEPQPRGGFHVRPGGDKAAPVEWWNGVSALLDFSHPNGRRWFRGELDRLRRDYGVDGFKFDGGSVANYVGVEALDKSLGNAGRSALYGAFALEYAGSEYRNAWGLAGKPLVVRLFDKDHSWNAVRQLIPDMLATGLIGYPFVCPDMVGGGSWTAFLPGSPFSQELFVRSAQVQALSPMMQISASPWRVLDEEHQAAFLAAVRLRQSFAADIVELAKRAAKDGEPIMRSLEYAYPGRGYAKISDEFLMGENLLVAPVVEKGAKTRKVAVPPGRWRADDGTEVEGPAEITVETPLARLPHFVRLQPEEMAERIKVALYLDNGCKGGGVIHWAQLLKSSPDVSCDFLDAADVLAGKLDGYDVLLMPGGSGYDRYAQLKEEGFEKIRKYIREGGSYCGVCAGIALALNDPKRLRLIPYTREKNPLRGGFSGAVELNARGEELLGVKAGTRCYRFHDGPLPAPGDPVPDSEYEVLATFDSDLMQKGKATTSMHGMPAVICGRYGKGRVLVSVMHPEYFPATHDVAGAFFKPLVGRAVTFTYREKTARPLRVAVYSSEIDRAGGTRAVVEDALALDARPDVDVTCVSGEQIAEGALDHADALVIPGGVQKGMWPAAVPLVERFKARGRGVYETCKDVKTAEQEKRE